jgi:hypothetical protein
MAVYIFIGALAIMLLGVAIEDVIESRRPPKRTKYPINKEEE